MIFKDDTPPSLAVFCDYENVALGARDAKLEAFKINLVLERLLDKGKIVLKKAYSDWDRYKSAKRSLHEAAFELIDIPHVRYSGKNSADIRMCVDALDLCHTKSHVDIFALITGDSDFSPLVSKLRENNKLVIGVGVRNSSSDLLIDNCDEFIFYDDLARKKMGGSRGGRARPAEARPPRKAAKPDPKPETKPETKGGTKPETKPDPKPETKAAAPPKKADPKVDVEEAVELVLDTVESLFRDRDDNLWGSMVKQTIKRKKPHFNESAYGFRTFNQLLEYIAAQGLLEIQKDEKGGGYQIIGFGEHA